MDSAYPKDIKNLLTLKEAANILAVSTDVLLSWNEHHILKPTITQDGQIGYTREQLDQFLKIKSTLENTIATPEPSNDLEKTPLSATSIEGDKKTAQERFVLWVGNGFYTHEHITDHLKSQVKESVKFNFKKPSLSFKQPSGKIIAISTGLLLIALSTLFILYSKS